MAKPDSAPYGGTLATVMLSQLQTMVWPSALLGLVLGWYTCLERQVWLVTLCDPGTPSFWDTWTLEPHRALPMAVCTVAFLDWSLARLSRKHP
jgi:hypothetical protein